MASTNIQVFYLRQQNKDTKNFLFFFTDFFVLYYGGDFISNNLNDNIHKKNYAFFFGFYFQLFFYLIYFSDLFFFPTISIPLLSLFFFFFMLFFFVFFVFFVFVTLGWTVE